jgi:hypothetical protein
MALFDFGDSGASWLSDIEFSPSFASVTPVKVATAPVVQQPVAMPQPVMQQSAITPSTDIMPISTIGSYAGAPAPVLPATNSIGPISTIGSYAGAPAPVLPATNSIGPIQPMPRPAPVVQQPVVQQPMVETPPAPSPLQILEQQQSVGMAPTSVPQPVASTPRQIPQVVMPQLSPQEQALFNRNIPSTGPARTATTQTKPAASAAMPSRMPVIAAAPPPRATQQAAAQNYSTMYQNQMNQYFPAPASTAVAKTTTTPKPPPTPAGVRATSTAVPYNMATLPQSVKPVTFQAPKTTYEDTYAGVPVKSQGRLTTAQIAKLSGRKI